MSRLRLKRVLDVELALLGVLVTAPVMAAVAFAVWRTMGRPVFFVHQRPGLDERPFGLVKFRSMSNARDAAGRLLPNASRLTTVGRFLRRTSLDELPELWNVLRGEMSVVGPRPLLMSYLPSYQPRERKRHRMRPGITGLAQVRGRNSLSWDDKMAADVEYIEHWSLSLDAALVARTFLRVVSGRDVGVEGGTERPAERHRRPDQVDA